jgi:hypothetical protein
MGIEPGTFGTLGLTPNQRLAFGLLRANGVHKYVLICLLLMLLQLKVRMEGEMKRCLAVSV